MRVREAVLTLPGTLPEREPTVYLTLVTGVQDCARAEIVLQHAQRSLIPLIMRMKSQSLKSRRRSILCNKGLVYDAMSYEP